MALREIIQIRDQPTEAAKVALRTAAGLKEKHNPLLMIPADLYRLEKRDGVTEVKEYNFYHMQEYTSGDPTYNLAGSLQVPYPEGDD